MSMATSLSKIS